MTGGRRLIGALLGLVALALPIAVVPAAPAQADGGSIVVTEADDMAQVTLHQGQQLIVELGPSGIFRWDQPTTSDPSVLRPTASGPPRRGHGRGHHHRRTRVRATFTAVGLGTADVQATGGPVCHQGHVCPLATAPTAVLVRLWQVHVQVV